MEDDHDDEKDGGSDGDGGDGGASVTRVFVYGTLLSGGPNYERILAPAIARGGARLLGAARTGYGWRLYSCGPFPAMAQDNVPSWRVVGEVFEVDADTLQALDRLEGVHPTNPARGHYTRQRIAVFLDGRRAPLPVDTYVQPLARQVGRPFITSGSWRAWEAKQRAFDEHAEKAMRRIAPTEGVFSAWLASGGRS